MARYELFYGSGGHGGPYPDLATARKRAQQLLEGSRSERVIHIRLYDAGGTGGYGPIVDSIKKNPGIAKNPLDSSPRRQNQS